MMKQLVARLSLVFLASVSAHAAHVPGPIPEADIRKEMDIQKRSQISLEIEPKPLNINEITSRNMELLYEPFGERPQDIFYIECQGITVVGRKLVSQLYIDQKILGMKCSQITAPMILGIFTKEKIVSGGVIVFYYPLENAEKLAIFNRIRNDVSSDLYFPYPHLNAQNEEAIWPVEFWDVTPEHRDNLDEGEVAFRRYVIAYLSQFDLKGKVLYDPSCSTGRFLGEIKKSYPEAYTIGQDINQKMVEHARQYSLIDEVHCGNSINSPIQDESVDFIFFRFLNLEVVTFDQAVELFEAIANRCKKGGRMILFGHTPVLLTAEWFEKLGLEVEQKIGINEDDHSIFQFYVLKKSETLPAVNYKTCTFL